MKQQTVVWIAIAAGGMVMLVAAVLVAVVAVIAISSSSPSQGIDIGLGDRVAVIDIEGVIWQASAQPVLEQLSDYAENPRVKAIVLNVDSPGGAVAPSQELYDAVRSARDEHGKVVVASFRSVAASGAYYLACGADEIISSPGCITGSIGVYMKFGNWQGLYEKIGIDWKTIQRGEFKTAGSSDREMRPEEQAMLQSMVDDIYEQFLEAVIDGRRNRVAAMYDAEVAQVERTADEARLQFTDTDDPAEILWGSAPAERSIEAATPAHATATAVLASTAELETVTGTIVAESDALLPPDPRVIQAEPLSPRLDSVDDIYDVEQRIRELAEGRIYTGRQAMEYGLVDGLGHLEDAVLRAADLAGIKGEPTVLHRRPQQEQSVGWLSTLAQEFEAHTSGTRPFVLYLMPFGS